MKLEYDGRPFAGWQRQADQPSVQEAVESGLAALEPDVTSIVAAGRTDAGVHATGQVAHADLSRDWDPFRLAEALNWHLKPAPVATVACATVPRDWSARFSAERRSYTYKVSCRRAPLVRDAGWAWHLRHDLDPDAMRAAARFLLGKHDFTTFRASICQAKSPVKTLDSITIESERGTAGREFRFHLSARSFLHNQVRSIVGTLERVGAGAWPPERVAEALAARDRAACGPVAPPDGLCLTEVGYPQDPFDSGWRDT